MTALLSFFLTLLVSPFKSRSRLEAENAALRHQLIVLQRNAFDMTGCLARSSSPLGSTTHSHANRVFLRFVS